MGVESEISRAWKRSMTFNANCLIQKQIQDKNNRKQIDKQTTEREKGIKKQRNNTKKERLQANEA
jgi:hypothetical protein